MDRRVDPTDTATPAPAPVLMLSSWVATGHVGLSAAAPALQALGRTATTLPTVILSNHPGFAAAAGQPVAPDILAGMRDALEANGWLAGHDALLVGYMPSPDHVAFAADLIDRLPGVRVVVDPILGDDPKGLYVPLPVAHAIRDRLLPRADVLTPNRFELAWLTGLPAVSLTEAGRAAEALRRETGADILVTSPPVGPGETGLLAVAEAPAVFRTDRLEGVPHGVGDVFAGLIAGGLTPAAALGHVAALARASLGAPHLRIAEAAALWTAASPCDKD